MVKEDSLLCSELNTSEQGVMCMCLSRYTSNYLTGRILSNETWNTKALLIDSPLCCFFYFSDISVYATENCGRNGNVNFDSAGIPIPLRHLQCVTQ